MLRIRRTPAGEPIGSSLIPHGSSGVLVSASGQTDRSLYKFDEVLDQNSSQEDVFLGMFSSISHFLRYCRVPLCIYAACWSSITPELLGVAFRWLALSLALQAPLQYLALFNVKSQYGADMLQGVMH